MRGSLLLERALDGFDPSIASATGIKGGFGAFYIAVAGAGKPPRVGRSPWTPPNRPRRPSRLRLLLQAPTPSLP
jgi:hypothetical protein